MSIVPITARVHTTTEIVRLAKWAGFTGTTEGRPNLAIAAAVCYHESSRDDLAGNYCCHGLMQINVLAHTQYTIAQMQNPELNFKAAFEIWDGSGRGRQGWLNWQTFEEGSGGNGYLVGEAYNEALAVLKDPHAAIGSIVSANPSGGKLLAPVQQQEDPKDSSPKIRATGKRMSESGNHFKGHTAAMRSLMGRKLHL